MTNIDVTWETRSRDCRRGAWGVRVRVRSSGTAGFVEDQERGLYGIEMEGQDTSS